MSAAVARDILARLDAPLVAWRAPILLGSFGLPGAGKTAVARWLAARYPLITLSTDALRLRYHLPSGPATIDVLYAVAAALLPQDAAVLLDGIHLQRHDRVRLRAFAEAHTARSALLHVTADRAIIARCLAARQRAAARTTAEGKFVITPTHFARIASWLEVPEAAEAVWPIDTTAGLPARQLADLGRWLEQFREPPREE